jgi:hypothetical protein
MWVNQTLPIKEGIGNVVSDKEEWTGRYAIK